MKQKHFPAEQDDPAALLGKAMGFGRDLAAKIHEATGVVATGDRPVMDAVARAAADRRLLEPGTRDQIERLLAALDRAIDVASEDRVEEFIVDSDIHGDYWDTRIVRAAKPEAASLVEIRNLASHVASLIDRVNDILEADRVVLKHMSDRFGR